MENDSQKRPLTEREKELVEFLAEVFTKQFIAELESDPEALMKRNPFADKDGKMIRGKEFEWLDWGKKANELYISRLPEDLRAKVIAANKHMRDKMES